MSMFIRRITVTTLAVISLVIAGCGGNGSSSGSLSLAVDKSSATGGDVIIATVTLTSSTPGKSLRGIDVRVMSSDQSAIADVSGTTNDNGIAVILLKPAWVNADKTVSLVAGSGQAAQSTSVKVTVTAPKLTINIPTEITPPTWNSNFGFIGRTIVSNYSLKFVDGNSNPIPNQAIKLYIDSITNKGFDDWIFYTPVQGALLRSPEPNNEFTTTTDSSGTAYIPMYIEMWLNQPSPCSTDLTTGVFSCSGTTLSIMTIHWRAVTQFAGQSYTTTGDSLVTFTNTGV